VRYIGLLDYTLSFPPEVTENGNPLQKNISNYQDR